MRVTLRRNRGAGAGRRPRVGVSLSGESLRYRSLRRVLPYMRPYRRALVVVGGVALVGLAAATAIPLVTKAVIDGPLADGDRTGLVALAALAFVFGTVEALTGYVRR